MQDTNTLWGNIRSATNSASWLEALQEAKQAPEEIKEECLQYVARAALASSQSRRDFAYAVVTEDDSCQKIAESQAKYDGVLEVGPADVTVASMSRGYILWSVTINEGCICQGHLTNSTLEQGWLKALSELHDICVLTLKAFQGGDVTRLANK